MPAKIDAGTLQGISAALQQAFDSDCPDDFHLGVKAAEADFAALRAQLNDPPPQYQRKSPE